jgi:hypothetical protein
VPRYLAEVYLTAPNAKTRARARAAAEAVDARLLRETFIPEDETWFLFFAAPSADAVVAALGGAGIEHTRLVETA